MVNRYPLRLFRGRCAGPARPLLPTGSARGVRCVSLAGRGTRAVAPRRHVTDARASQVVVFLHTTVPPPGDGSVLGRSTPGAHSPVPPPAHTYPHSLRDGFVAIRAWLERRRPRTPRKHGRFCVRIYRRPAYAPAGHHHAVAL